MRILMMLLTLGWAVDLSAPGDLTLIDELNECMSARFQDPSPNALGMSRVAMPPSFGTHYQPFVTRDRDFRPENARETKALAALEDRKMQVGFYLFGRAVVEAKSEALYYRALKGPGAITIGTPRAAWYPGSPQANIPTGDGLPDWKAIYPLARKAMKSFEDGGKGFEATVDSWQVAARPLLAGQERCLACHNNASVGTGRRVELNQAIGGVLYAFRRARTLESMEVGAGKTSRLRSRQHKIFSLPLTQATQTTYLPPPFAAPKIPPTPAVP